MIRKIARAALCVLCIASLTSCSGAAEDGRQVIQQPDKEITVIENNEENKNISYNEPVLEKIESIEGMRAQDWLDDNTIIISMSNNEAPQMQSESGMVYPKNFYTFDIKDRKSSLLLGSEKNLSNGILSPDKKHLFYKEGIEENLTGYILNMETMEKHQITNVDDINSYVGSWVDNDTVIMSSIADKAIYIADTKGNVIKMTDSKKKMISNTALVGEALYYTTTDGKLYVQSIKTSIKTTEEKLLKENVVWLIPSPDKTQLAMVLRTEPAKMLLAVTDLEGNIKKELAKGTQIYGASWSPDQTKLAYTTMSEALGEKGLFIADVATGAVTQLAVDLEFASDHVKWSPSGKMLMLSNTVEKDNRYQFVTYIMYSK